VTLGCGFKGGEMVPTFFIGATLGCVVGPLLGLPAGFSAAIALIAVFCGAVNCPIAAIALSVELFGSTELTYFALACGISFMLSGYTGLYRSQKIIYSKTKGGIYKHPREITYLRGPVSGGFLPPEIFTPKT
jgi:H+/Cl- antiporter ClcA